MKGLGGVAASGSKARQRGCWQVAAYWFTHKLCTGRAIAEHPKGYVSLSDPLLKRSNDYGGVYILACINVN